MFIKEIINPFDDDGVSTVRLQTPTKTFEGIFRVFNGPEIRTWKRHHNNSLNLPGHMVEFTGDTPKRVIEQLKRKGIVVKYFPKPNMSFTLDLSEAVIRNQIDLGFQIIGVPDYNESFIEFREKLGVIPKILREHPNGNLVSVMPYIRSDLDSKPFEKRLYEILDRGYNMIGFQIRGYKTTNLAYAKQVLKKQPIDIWRHASDMKRKYDNISRASYPHILTYYGIHTSTLREGKPTYFHRMKPEETIHFDCTRLGILPWCEVSQFFGVDCSCKYHNYGGKYFTEDAKEMAERSRIHEMVNGQIELKRAETTIQEEIFEQYIKNKSCAATAIFR